MPGFHAGNLPSLANADWQEFTRASGVAGTAGNWSTWIKPAGASMIYMLTISGGGAGGAGQTGATTTVRCGGGGGGSGARSTLWIPAHFVPDSLSIFVGIGGVPVNNAAGGAGSRSRISWKANQITTSDEYLDSDSGNAGGGGKGTTTAGAAGAAGAAATAGFALSFGGFFTFSAGQAGSASGAIGGANGVAVTFNSGPNALLGTGGTGGGTTPAANTDFTGGAITGAGPVPTLAGGAIAENGNNGWTKRGPLWLAVGGTGGGTSQATAGTGGNGGRASGGGGGGGGVIGGQGGRGGPGYVLIGVL